MPPPREETLRLFMKHTASVLGSYRCTMMQNVIAVCLFPLSLFFFATAFPRNAPCPPARWVDSGSVHPWHCVRVSHAAVPGPDRVCRQREQHSCGPSGRGESGRPSQRDGVGSGETQKKPAVVDSCATQAASAEDAKK